MLPGNKASNHALEGLISKNAKKGKGKSKLKAMLFVFFDLKGVITIEWVPKSQIDNQ